MTMTNAELRELSEAATPGPWEWVGGNLESRAAPYEVVTLDHGEGYLACPRIVTSDADAALIAATRNELPRLLDDSDRLAKLRRYARHDWGCAISRGDCSCGLRELLAEGSG